MANSILMRTTFSVGKRNALHNKHHPLPSLYRLQPIHPRVPSALACLSHLLLVLGLHLPLRLVVSSLLKT